jgi:hypothetical protein
VATAPDEFVIDKYKLLACISSGQHSQIWDCVEAAGNTGRHFAMKLLQEKAMKEPAQVASLKHEYAVGSSLGHPNILKYVELYVKKGRGFFIMELFTSPNIKQLLYSDVGAMQQRCHRIIELTALALEHMHQKGWIHRDIKPDNILATRGGDVRLIDFSLTCKPPSLFAKWLGKKPPIQGTRTYMSPEQILRRPVSFQTDIYSLGITLFEILAGEPPFKGSSPQDLLVRHVSEPAPLPSFFNPNVTPEADAILERMLKKKPADRYPSMGEFLAEFRKTNLFKEVPQDQATAKAAAEKAQFVSEDSRLNSRADALRKTLADSAEAIKLPPEAKAEAAPAGGTAPAPAGARPGAPAAGSGGAGAAPAKPGPAAGPGQPVRPGPVPAGAAGGPPKPVGPGGAPAAGGARPGGTPPAGAPPRPGAGGVPAGGARPAGTAGPASGVPAGAAPRPGQPVPARPAPAGGAPTGGPPRPAGAPGGPPAGARPPGTLPPGGPVPPQRPAQPPAARPGVPPQRPPAGGGGPPPKPPQNPPKQG